MLNRLESVRARYRDEALARGISPRDVDLLLSDLLAQPITFLIAHGEALIDPAPLDELMQRRYAGEPLQYIRRRAEFFSRQFYVDERALIPRPETEVLVEAALERAGKGARVADIGTGSGCIAISLERERPDLRVIGIDVSVDALAVAGKNLSRLGSRVALVASDLFEAITGRFDLIVSNPPYVTEEEVEHLAKEVGIHEPRVALTPGPRGVEIIERILEQARPRLAKDGRVMMEIGFGQESLIRDVADLHGFDVEAFLPDLAGIPRVVILSRPAAAFGMTSQRRVVV